MTLMSFTTTSAISCRRRYTVGRERCWIIAFVAITVVLMIIVFLCNGIGMFMQHKNNSDSENLESNNNNENAISQLVNNMQIVWLTNENSAKPNESSSLKQVDINTIKTKSNNKNNNNNNNNKREQQNYEINIAGDENSHANSEAIYENNSNLFATQRAVSYENDFVDEINIGNQHGELSKRPTAMKSTVAATTKTSAAQQLTVIAFMPSNANAIDDVPVSDAPRAINDAVSNTDDGAGEQMEYDSMHKSGQLETNQPNSELILHRQKRYLIFPEGSSFQMVFDLIIGVVDYSSYAILGITCAVAWELPSKPPSELIENLHDKITEGIYTTSETKPPPAGAAAMRRNDSITLTDSRGDAIGAGIKYGTAAEGNKYVDTANMSPHTPPYINYENMLATRVLTAATPPAQPTPLNVMETSYYTHYSPQRNPFAAPIASYNAYKKVTSPNNNNNNGDYTNDGAYQPSNYYANDAYQKQNRKYYYTSSAHKYNFRDKNVKSSYYNEHDEDDDDVNYSNNHKNPFGYSPFGDSTDKQPVKFVNRWQQQHWQQKQQKQQEQKYPQRPQYKKWQSWKDYDSNWRKYEGQNQKHAQQQKQQQTESKYVGTDNWWSRNKQRVEDSWRTKQTDLRDHNVRIPGPPSQSRQPVMTYSPPTENYAKTDSMPVNPKSDAIVEGRSFTETPRLIISKPPRAKIYPVFGGRRRRRRKRQSGNAKLNDFEVKLERIHLREQLRTRQKLYGKIEKLYETRGLNGSACVLRALCETGQQQRQQRKRKDTTEPQSFITELLRAIFTLPTISINNSGESVKFEEPALHPTDLHIIHRTYREARMHRGSCAQLFAMCEHSFWE